MASVPGAGVLAASCRSPPAAGRRSAPRVATCRAAPFLVRSGARLESFCFENAKLRATEAASEQTRVWIGGSSTLEVHALQ
jgi:hypothetical protein